MARNSNCLPLQSIPFLNHLRTQLVAFGLKCPSSCYMLIKRRALHCLVSNIFFQKFHLETIGWRETNIIYILLLHKMESLAAPDLSLYDGEDGHN